MTFTSNEVKNVRIIRVIRSPKEDATGVAMLSAESIFRFRGGLPGLMRNLLETRTRDDMNALSTTLEKLAPIIALTIIRALSNHVSR